MGATAMFGTFFRGLRAAQAKKTVGLKSHWVNWVP